MPTASPNAQAAPRYVDIDPLMQIVIELRVLTEIIAQANDLVDRVETLRASVYSDFTANPTLNITP